MDLASTKSMRRVPALDVIVFRSLTANAGVSEVQYLMSGGGSAFRIERRHIAGSSPLVEVGWICLRGANNSVHNEALGALAVENEAASEPITRIGLPGPKFLPGARHAEDNWVIAWLVVKMHVYSECTDRLFRFCAGIVRKSRFCDALANRHDGLHGLKRVERKVACARYIKLSGCSDSTAPQHLEVGSEFVPTEKLNRCLPAIRLVELQFKPLPNAVVVDHRAFQRTHLRRSGRAVFAGLWTLLTERGRQGACGKNEREEESMHGEYLYHVLICG